MAKSDADRIERRRKYVPVRYLGIFDRVVNGGNSRADAVKLQCLECNGYSYIDARQCSEVVCPLYHFNPYRISQCEGDEGGVDDVESTNEG